MKYILNISIFLFVSFSSFCQELEKEYQSTEESKYYEKKSFKGFKPYSVQQTKTLKYDQINIREDKLKDNKFGGIYDFFNLTDGTSETIKARTQGIVYEIYRDPALENDNWGYWLKEETTKTIGIYYLGITENYFYHIKAKQTIPLIKNDSTIQVQAAIVRQVKPEILPSEPPEFKIVEDHVILDININQVKKDSDNDGLSNIVEEKLMLDPYSNDTDSDGIEDNKDPNPRFKSWETERSKLYSYVLAYQPRDSVVIDPNIIINKENKSSSENPMLIVTDDESLQHVKPLSNEIQYIILSSSELNENKKKYPISINKLFVSPLFKVDNIDDCYKIHIGGSFWGNDYIIYKKNNKWVIKWTSGYII